MKLSCEVDLYVRLCAVMVLSLLGVAVRAQTSATLTGLGTNAPTPGTNDISQLLTSGQTNMPEGLNYYTDNGVNHPTVGEPGQTFTTGTNGAGYLLNSAMEWFQPVAFSQCRLWVFVWESFRCRRRMGSVGKCQN